VQSDIEHVLNRQPGEPNGVQSRATNGATAASQRLQMDHGPIIAHCHLRWDFVWQRPQQIFSRLARFHPILLLEEPIFEGAEQHLRISEPQANIVRVIPFLPSTVGGVDAQREAILAMLREALAQHPLIARRFDSPIQWFYSPVSAPCFLGEFGTIGVVYDCMDELANFRFALPDIAERERFLLSKANVVFTGGYQLFQSKSRFHTNVHFFGCGVDASHYSSALADETPLPPDIAHLPHPIMGYFGVIDERIDYDLLARVGESFPHGSLVMIGPLAKVERNMLPSLDNIHWLGQRAYADLPAYLKGFDVCLMPFALNDATRYINPTKTLEYMAAGKPIVSTAVPDVVHNFTPVVEVAASSADFVPAIKRALTSPDAQRIEEGIRRANGASWEAIVSAMRSHMLQAISGSAKSVSSPGAGDFP
jgi:glycosyltransferase involved in cell wall biosynthesis